MRWIGWPGVGWGGGVEPLILVVPAIVATTKTPTVALFSRCSVSQVACWACSHDLAPVAPAIAVKAQAAHIGEKDTPEL